MLYQFLAEWGNIFPDEIFATKTTAFWHMTLTSLGYLPMLHTNLLLPTTSIFISYTLKLGITSSSETILYL